MSRWLANRNPNLSKENNSSTGYSNRKLSHSSKQDFVIINIVRVPLKCKTSSKMNTNSVLHPRTVESATVATHQPQLLTVKIQITRPTNKTWLQLPCTKKVKAKGLELHRRGIMRAVIRHLAPKTETLPKITLSIKIWRAPSMIDTTLLLLLRLL